MIAPRRPRSASPSSPFLRRGRAAATKRAAKPVAPTAPPAASSFVAKSADELEREAKAARSMPRPGWASVPGAPLVPLTKSEAKEGAKPVASRWHKPSVAYVVIWKEHRSNGRSLPMPWCVLDAKGTLLAQATHLKKAQETAEVLGQPISGRYEDAVAACRIGESAPS